MNMTVIFISVFVLGAVIAATLIIPKIAYIANDYLIMRSVKRDNIIGGNNYFLANYTTLNNLDNLSICMQTFSDMTPFIDFGLWSEEDAEIIFYENINLTHSKKIMPFNNNRNSLNNSNMTLSLNCTKNNIGDIIFRQRFNATSLNIRDMILKANTFYILEIESKEDNNIVNFNINWDES